MTCHNMVENNEQIYTDKETLENDKSAKLVVDKLLDSVLRMEHSWEFARLPTDKEKVCWALCHAEDKIKYWHEREGINHHTYQNWREELLKRFLFHQIEMIKILSKERRGDQSLSNFIAEMIHKGKALKIDGNTLLSLIKYYTRKEDIGSETVLQAEVLSEDLLRNVEIQEEFISLGTLQRKMPVIERDQKVIEFSNLALKCEDTNNPNLEVYIDGRKTIALCDTGSDINLIHSSLVEKWKIQKSRTAVYAANGQELDIAGEAYLTVEARGESSKFKFIVSSNLRVECILGIPFLRARKVVISFNCAKIELEGECKSKKLLDRLNKQKNGPVSGVECCIDTEPGKKVMAKYYTLPQALEERVLKEIESLKSKGYITESKSSWLNNMVPVQKADGSMRITINYKLLNQLVKQDKYSLPRIDGIIHGLYGQRIFSKIDLKDGFFTSQ